MHIAFAELFSVAIKVSSSHKRVFKYRNTLWLIFVVKAEQNMYFPGD